MSGDSSLRSRRVGLCAALAAAVWPAATAVDVRRLPRPSRREDAVEVHDRNEPVFELGNAAEVGVLGGRDDVAGRSIWSAGMRITSETASRSGHHAGPLLTTMMRVSAVWGAAARGHQREGR